MKLLLFASLIANVLLVMAVTRRHAQRFEGKFVESVPVQIKSKPADAPTSSNSQPKQNRSKAWQTIENTNWSQFVANLRAAGCPEQTIQHIVITGISREFQARLQAAYEEAARQQLWWRPQNPSLASTQLSQQRPALMHERDDLVEELFGEPAKGLILEMLSRSGVASGREFLTVEKRASLREIETRFGQMNEELTRDAGMPIDDEDRAAIRDLQQRKRSEIKTLLTSDEIDQLDMRESPISKYVLSNLPAAETESDFRIMFFAARDMGVGGNIENEITAAQRRYGLTQTAISDPQQGQQEDRKRAVEARVKEQMGKTRFNYLLHTEKIRQAR